MDLNFRRAEPHDTTAAQAAYRRIIDHLAQTVHSAVKYDLIGKLAADTHLTRKTITATAGTLPTANGAVTIANAATPTVAELQEAVVELNAKVSAIIAALEGAGITAAS